MHAMHTVTQELGLKYAARVIDSGGSHRTFSPSTRRQPLSLFTAALQACPRRPPAIDIPSSIAEGPGRGRFTKFGV